LTSTTKQPFDTLQDSPFWVGQLIDISGTQVGNALALSQQNTITGVEWVKGGANDKK